MKGAMKGPFKIQKLYDKLLNDYYEGIINDIDFACLLKKECEILLETRAAEAKAILDQIKAAE